MIDEWQNPGCGELARPAGPGAAGQSIDALCVEARDPESQAAFAPAAVAQDQIEGHADEQQVDGIETGGMNCRPGNRPWPALARGKGRFQGWATDGDGRSLENKSFKRSYQPFVRSFGNYFWQPV